MNGVLHAIMAHDLPGLIERMNNPNQELVVEGHPAQKLTLSGLALIYDNAEALAALLGMGADVHHPPFQKPQHGWAQRNHIAFLAAMLPNPALMQTLLTLGPAGELVTRRTARRWVTPLMMSISADHGINATALYTKGADITTRTKDGKELLKFVRKHNGPLRKQVLWWEFLHPHRQTCIEPSPNDLQLERYRCWQSSGQQQFALSF